MSDQKWSTADIPDQTGRIAIITGANSGLGYETSLALAQKGCRVIMACRSLNKANTACDSIKSNNPSGLVEVMQLDLNDLDAVKTFAFNFKEKYNRLDLLINNAGIMHPPYSKTVQGFETQFGVNHLAHFALTGLLLDTLKSTPESRVVTVSSNGHKLGKINFDDLQWEEGYKDMAAYGQSKLANLLFTYELQRKLESAGYSTIATAAHPGWSGTNLMETSPFIKLFTPLLSQKPDQGALPTLRAATDPKVNGADYFGPSRLEMVGAPVKVKSNKRSKDKSVAKQLWSISEKLTGVSYTFN